jgi:hypothetical protein
MFTTKLDLFSIGTIEVPTHTRPITKPIFIPNLSIIKPVPKRVELVCVLVINLVISPNTIKQCLLESFFHPKVGEIIIDETFSQ